VKYNRIDAIIKQIKINGNVIDIGSDHAQLAIRLLKTKKAMHVYNIELNKQPYLITIKNLTQMGLLAQTTNHLGDGLQSIKIDEIIDYCVIAGMGSNNIINILSHRNKSIRIKTFIFLPNDCAKTLREYLKQKGYKISYEQIVKEGHYYYPLMVVSQKQGLSITNKAEVYFGPYNLKYPSLIFQQMHQRRIDYIKDNKLYLHSQLIQQEFKLLKEEQKI
jgi:tRNA (adenine22-N1)-methyltransferase